MMENIIFRNFLGGKGLKLTKERTAVLSEVYSFHGHFEPEYLYSRIKGSGSKASRASVYRTLSLLVECGLVKRVTRTDKGNIYEHTYGHSHHDHMICDICGEIIEFFSEKLEKLQDEICEKNSFIGSSHALEIRGRCKKCRM
ncbi:Similar to ferric uptake regulation protein [Candidatus Sulfobium mesophilum]|uniref:Ferric uptake regulation protein n=1 Tax=Candidatus Sulfobium mesophilum TaxID=2016548 RepID=A0A2U3QGY1_9BACT|nr:Similar to ferric uptake regulation protein [Candidatus Sulfobium mesophilum]